MHHISVQTVAGIGSDAGQVEVGKRSVAKSISDRKAMPIKGGAEAGIITESRCGWLPW